MEQPKFRGFSLETGQWHYGHGWFKCDYTEEYKKEKGIEDKAILYTEGSPIECELKSMGRYVKTVKLGDSSEDLYEGDIVADLSESELTRKYEIAWDDYGMFLFVPLFASETGAIDYYELEELHGDYIFVFSNVFENPELAVVK